MSGYLDRVQPQPVAQRMDTMGGEPLMLPWTREARQMARSDRQAVVRARDDFNRARVALHKIHLNTLLERAEADQRAELATYSMHKIREVDDVANLLCTMNRPALELTIREIQSAYNSGEAARVLRRAFES